MRFADSTTINLTPACKALSRGGIVAFPTEAVYGLSCDPACEDAVERLLRLKQRPRAKGLILLAGEIDHLQRWTVPFDAEMLERIGDSWPGPVTWLVPAAPNCPSWLRGNHDSIAVRVTAHPLAADLCRQWSGAVVSTSANRTGEPPLMDGDSVRAAFGDQLDVVVDGPVGGLAAPTPIIDVRTGRIVRA